MSPSASSCACQDCGFSVLVQSYQRDLCSIKRGLGPIALGPGPSTSGSGRRRPGSTAEIEVVVGQPRYSYGVTLVVRRLERDAEPHSTPSPVSALRVIFSFMSRVTAMLRLGRSFLFKRGVSSEYLGYLLYCVPPAMAGL